MSKRLDLVGKRYSLLFVLSFSHVQRINPRSSQSFWKCKCDCGNTVTKCGSELVRETIKSCGCTKKPIMGNRRHPIYGIWCHIKSRCLNKLDHKYFMYGGRGITVCDLWIHDFSQFCNDVGPRPGPEYSLDRIDNDGNYSPGNVRWATNKMQCNNKRNNRFLTYNSITLTVQQWSERLGIKRSTIAVRLMKGWPIEKALSIKRYERKLKTA